MKDDVSFSKGFTLLELLIVIAIIGLLASVVLVSFPGATKKARDAQRKSDLSQIHQALELLYTSTGSYEDSGELCADTSIGSDGCSVPNPPRDNWDPNSNLQALVRANLMPVLPVDPINDSTYYYFFEPNSDSQGNCSDPSWAVACEYTLCVTRLETTGQQYCNDSFGIRGE